MEIKGDTVTFSSGRTRYANNGIIGLSPTLQVSEGYDGGFQTETDGWSEPDEDDLTKEDLAELADYMIEQWGKFKDKSGAPTNLRQGEIPEDEARQLLISLDPYRMDASPKAPRPLK